MVATITAAAARINSYAQQFYAAKFLAIGVNRGNTFFSVERIGAKADDYH